MSENKTAPAESRSRRSHRGERICEDLSFAAKEAFKRLRTNLIASFPEEEPGCRLVGITSAQPSDGKSTVAIDLAYSLAELEQKVLLIDADMRRSSIHVKAGLEHAPGLSELLDQSDDVRATIQRYDGRTGVGFDIITAGEPPKNPSERLNSKRMATLLQKLAEAYDYILVDLPPIGAVVDAAAVSKHLDGMLVVVRENACPRGLLAECMSQLRYAGANVLGFVANGAVEGSGKKYQYGKYGYYNDYYY